MRPTRPIHTNFGKYTPPRTGLATLVNSENNNNIYYDTIKKIHVYIRAYIGTVEAVVVRTSDRRALANDTECDRHGAGAKRKLTPDARSVCARARAIDYRVRVRGRLRVHVLVDRACACVSTASSMCVCARGDTPAGRPPRRRRCDQPDDGASELLAPADRAANRALPLTATTTNPHQRSIAKSANANDGTTARRAGDPLDSVRGTDGDDGQARSLVVVYTRTWLPPPR